jgi:hypothetical protein
MVLGHPREKFVLDALPSQPIGLGAHRKWVSDLSDRIHCGAARQRSNDLVSDSPHARLECSHALGREERVDNRPKR